MIMVRAIVRPEKVDEVLEELMYAGFPSVTKVDVFGRGKQRGIKAGDVSYDELPKVMLFTVIDDKTGNSLSRP
jgi:nitrogen regulatory protein PII 1